MSILLSQNTFLEMEASQAKDTGISRADIWGEQYFKISNIDELRPFFMNIVSDGNHWIFISSNGGLSVGRKNAQFALFPYYTDDKITESADITGSKSIFRVRKNDKTHIWEPYSDRYEGTHRLTRNLYKNNYGNKIIFEEINHDLELTYRYAWNTSNLYGFVRKTELINDAEENVQVSLIDGIQNVIPYGVNTDLQNGVSNLVDAYKRTELESKSGLGIFSLSAIIVDKAEPSEALRANVAWSLGLGNPSRLLSSLQLKNFRRGKQIQEELDVKAEKGAYFLYSNLNLSPKEEKEWMIMADVNKSHTDIARLQNTITEEKNLYQKIKDDVELGTKKLVELDAASDGIQLTSDSFRDTRHFSNTLFNIMRGGIFDNNYQIEKWDFTNYLSKANKNVFNSSQNVINELPDEFPASELKRLVAKTNDPHLARLCLEYMPLKFSRRHGDPSRPWNKFSINTRNEIDGSKILDYEGNWRDIFQNWEALAHSYPDFVESMIHKFLNATTFDGYNPYRVTKGGFDWETIEPDNPWSYIGYWGDHQIIYLLKFLEFIENNNPGKLESYFDKNCFVYANVPYTIKNYQEILKDPKDTIEFDETSDLKIRADREKIGADAALLHLSNNEIYTVNFIEKILATTLAKLSNYIPEGGIWMNTQRPEWNDANNALVGNGVSMVTLNYLRRYMKFFRRLVSNSTKSEVSISDDLAVFYHKVKDTFTSFEYLLEGKINDTDRKTVMDHLGQAGSDYREKIYGSSFTGNKKSVSLKGITEFIDSCINHLEHTIRANKRKDNLFHAYNLMTVENDKEVSISYLSEMLEGQVAVLSSGYLYANTALEALDALKNSALFREDQYSYILYPNKNLPKFIEKNNIPAGSVEKSALLMKLVADKNISIIEKDINGIYHFNGMFNNAKDLSNALDVLSGTTYEALAEKERAVILQTFEEVFNHKEFTGRSGTFFGYEGLGSIYWHMVSKLLLAVQECCIKAIRDEESPEIIGRLLEHYYEINAGIGVHKSPSLYGAFPTDAYSHTPGGKGAQQPGMTGQVKEDILCRFGELGIFVEAGKLLFNPCLLRKNEFLSTAEKFNYVNVKKEHKVLDLEENSLCFTYCQVPVVYKIADKNSMQVHYSNGRSVTFDSLLLDEEISQFIFGRTGEIESITAYINQSILK